jgi:hypothetical protein
VQNGRVGWGPVCLLELELDHCAGASKNPLALFEEAERRRRRKGSPRETPIAHLRYGRLDSAIERSLELERPELVAPDAAELERLFAKHADIAEGT